MKKIMTLAFVFTLCTSTVSGEESVGAWHDYARPAAFEVNILWPFFPGGIVDFKLMIPALNASKGDWRGEVIVGVHSDFGWRGIRPADEYGQVAKLSGKIGWRQFLVYGLHLDVTLNAGWRNEVDHPHGPDPINSFQGRLWNFAGYQHEFTRTFYANTRFGVGVHAFRTDEFADTEKIVALGGDLNLGFRF